MQDLFQALQMFQQGVKDVAFSSALNQANEQVQQIKASITNEAEQRAALHQVSQDIVGRMTAMGATGAQLQAAQTAFGPRQFANSNAMAAEAVMGGDPALMGKAAELQAFEQNPAYKVALLQAKAATRGGGDQMAQLKFEEMKQQFADKEFAKFSKALDPTAEVRSSFGRAAQTIQRANALETLVGKASFDLQAANKLPPNMVFELATGLASMVKGGVPAESDIAHFAPQTVGMKEAELKQFLSNELQGANAGAWVQLYSKTIQRERAEMQIEVEDTVLKRARGNIRLYDRDPETFKQTLADRLGVAAEDVVVDPKKRTVTTRQRQEVDQQLGVAHGALKEAYLAANSSKPEDKAKAQQVFRQLGIRPGTPIKQAMEDVKFRITRGVYGQ